MLEGSPIPDKREVSSVPEIKEKIFSDIIVGRLISNFDEALDEAGYSAAERSDIQKELEHYSDAQIRGALAIPKEISQRYLEKIHESDPKKVAETLVQNAEKYGFTVGYHVTSNEIQEGHIKGTEKDHRDDDLTMAYYSLHYKDLYLKKSGRFLYLVRAETGKNSTHRQDNDGSWGRAASLAIIDRLDLFEVRAQVDSRVREFDKQKEKAA